MICSSKRPGCELEFALPVARMKEAFRKADEYDIEKAPYGIPTYPYRWSTLPEHMTIRLDMGYRGANRYVAAFVFEFTSSLPESRCHVSVWVIRPTDDPTMEGFAALPSKDTRLHMEARFQFIGVLLGLRSHYLISPPLDEDDGDESSPAVFNVSATIALRSDGSRSGVAPPP